MAIEQGQIRQDTTINTIGPDTFTYRELVGEIGAIVGRNRPIVSVPPSLGYLVAAVIGRIVGDARYQFCAYGQGLREYPLEIEAILAEGRAIDCHLYSHRVTLLDELARVVEELLLAELSFRDQRVPWTGLGATGMYANGIDACREVQGLLVERGYQWCSTRYVKDSDIADMQPYWLDEHLLEIPCVGMSDRNYFYDRQAPPSGLIWILVRYLQESVAKDLVYAIFLHPGVLARFDPDCDVVAALVERAGELGVPICIYDLARRFSRLQGFEPGTEIEIEFTGVRPGENWLRCWPMGVRTCAPPPTSRSGSGAGRRRTTPIWISSRLSIA